MLTLPSSFLLRRELSRGHPQSLFKLLLSINLGTRVISTTMMNGTPCEPLSVPPPMNLVQDKINVPVKRLLMGPGPSNCPPRILEGNGLPIIGHMHPEFFKIMDECKAGLKYLFQTNNDWTLVISGPGHLAMEAIFVNLVEPGEKVVIGVNGIWGIRAEDLVRRLGGVPIKVEAQAGRQIPLGDITKAVEEHKPSVLFIIHSESSSGVMQGLEGLGELCQKNGCLLAVDTVASLGGVPFYTDKWKLDAVYTGSQKVIGAPPGIAPITFGPRAVEKIKNRKTPIKSFLLDMNLLSVYWACSPGDVRTYHHTAPVNLIYGLREGLSLLVEEGLENLWKRHAEMSKRLQDGIKGMGLELFVENEKERLPTVTTIKVPEGVDWKMVTKVAMEQHNIEIAGGLGPTVGKALRIGVMGYNAYPEKVDRTLAALKDALSKAKY